MGDLERHVWFDASGAWAQWRLWRQGLIVLVAHGREAWLAAIILARE